MPLALRELTHLLAQQMTSQQLAADAVDHHV